VAATVLVVASLALVPLVGVGGHHRAGTPSPSAPSPAPRALVSTFVTIDSSTDPYSVTGGLRGTLDLRDASDGHLIRTLLTTPSGATIDATRAPDGTLIVAVADGCSSRIERVDGNTGRVTALLRTVEDNVSGIALSPDGTRLAYVTYASCNAMPPTCNPNESCEAEFGPSTLVILDLASGAAVRAASATPEFEIGGLSWSPDGRQLLAEDLSGVKLIDPDHPNIDGARHLPEPAGNCSYDAGTWTTAGIVVVKACRNAAIAPTLVRVDPDGVVNATWALPTCTSPGDIVTDPTRTRVYVDFALGYGNGVCGKKFSVSIATLDGSAIRKIITSPGSGPHWILVSG
jgi:dipeptidyl aminopeptidase/acylaminoacyl peptidase